MSDPMNKRLGDYEILKVLGSGGMGRVYQVRNAITDRVEAMKVLLPDLEGHEDVAARFQREIKVLAALNHPNIAHIYEIGEAGGVNFIAMEFIDGFTLSELFHGRRTDLSKLLRHLQHAAEALAKAHAAGIVHRDLKPDNVILAQLGGRTVPKLVDFGVAKVLDDVTEAPLTGAGKVLGSPAYMSPEQARGLAIDARADVWSFCTVLYEAATGVRPFDGASAVDALTAVVSVEPRPMSAYGVRDAALWTIVRRLISFGPPESGELPFMTAFPTFVRRDLVGG